MKITSNLTCLLTGEPPPQGSGQSASGSTSAQQPQGEIQTKSAVEDFYDDVYFDSDSDDESQSN
jgi:hypothetical protein